MKPDQIALLARILDQHCSTYGIRTPEGRESVAASIMRHFQNGLQDPVALAILLEQEDAPVTSYMSAQPLRAEIAGES